MDDILKGGIAALKNEREFTSATLLRIRISHDRLQAFSALMREHLTGGQFHSGKACLGSIIDRVEIDDGIVRILGRKDVLEQAVQCNGGLPLGVYGSVRKWRTLMETVRTNC